MPSKPSGQRLDFLLFPQFLEKPGERLADLARAPGEVEGHGRARAGDLLFDQAVGGERVPSAAEYFVSEADLRAVAGGVETFEQREIKGAWLEFFARCAAC